VKFEEAEEEEEEEVLSLLASSFYVGFLASWLRCTTTITPICPS
jgi:hypothetical protein